MEGRCPCLVLEACSDSRRKTITVGRNWLSILIRHPRDQAPSNRVQPPTDLHNPTPLAPRHRASVNSERPRPRQRNRPIRARRSGHFKRDSGVRRIPLHAKPPQPCFITALCGIQAAQYWGHGPGRALRGAQLYTEQVIGQREGRAGAPSFNEAISV